jgi:PhzF family phenazine biosynthesis protein
MAKKSAKPAKASSSKSSNKPAARKSSPVKKAAKSARRPGAARTHKAAKSPGRKPARSARKETVLPFFQVDSFTGRLFHGNPAGVVLLEKWLPAEVMQAIAAENNLAETAFVTPASGKAAQGGTRLAIRWFTPAVEVELCGHATLAAAHVLWRHVGVQAQSLTFESASGPLHVEREKDLLVLDFPSLPGRKSADGRAVTAALGRAPVEVYESSCMMAVFENKRDVHELIPDLEAIAALDTLGVIVTAPGVGHDFVSRFFAPALGIDEDPVTGAAHCTLAPYWSARLGKSKLTAHQVSSRGGELFCEVRGERVRIGGRAVTYLDGRIRI